MPWRTGCGPRNDRNVGRAAHLRHGSPAARRRRPGAGTTRRLQDSDSRASHVASTVHSRGRSRRPRRRRRWRTSRSCSGPRRARRSCAARPPLADAVRVTLGPEVEVRPDREEVGQADRLQRRRHHRQGVRAEGPRREPRRADAPRRRPSAPATPSATAPARRRILAHAIFADGVRNIAAGASAIDLKRGLDRGAARGDRGAARAVAAGARAGARRSRSRRSPRTTTRRSASSSPTRWRRSAPRASITVEEAKGTETTLEVVEGLQFDRGYLSPYFVTDPEKMEAVLEDAAHPALRGQDRQSSRTCCRCSSRSPSAGAPLLVIAEDVEGEALATLVVNKLRGVARAASP